MVGYASLAAAAGSAKLAKIHDSIKIEFESVQHLEVSRFETIPSADAVIFDVRPGERGRGNRFCTPLQ